MEENESGYGIMRLRLWDDEMVRYFAGPCCFPICMWQTESQRDLTAILAVLDDGCRCVMGLRHCSGGHGGICVGGEANAWSPVLDRRLPCWYEGAHEGHGKGMCNLARLRLAGADVLT